MRIFILAAKYKYFRLMRFLCVDRKVIVVTGESSRCLHFFAV